MTPALIDRLQAVADALGKEVGPAIAKAQRGALTAWLRRSAFPGVASRFLARWPRGSKTYFPRSLGGWGFVPRRNRQTRRQTLPAWTHTGAMRAEILARRPRTVRSSTAIRTLMSIHPRVLNVLGQRRGVTGKTRTQVATTYRMKVYRDAVHRAGAYFVSVTRRIPRVEWQKAPITFSADWAIRPAERAYVEAAYQIFLRHHLRTLRRRLLRGAGRRPRPTEAA